MKPLYEKFRLAKEFLSHPCLQDFIDAGIINQISERNCRIIVDYHSFREHYDHLDSLTKLSEKYFLSEDRLLSILYK